jgi:MFS family permease
MQFFFAPAWGRLSDRIGRRPVMLVSNLGAAVPTRFSPSRAA